MFRLQSATSSVKLRQSSFCNPSSVACKGRGLDVLASSAIVRSGSPSEPQPSTLIFPANCRNILARQSADRVSPSLFAQLCRPRLPSRAIFIRLTISWCPMESIFVMPMKFGPPIASCAIKAASASGAPLCIRICSGTPCCIASVAGGSIWM